MSSLETIGSYKLGKTLGKGAYGKVKLGVHERSGNQVAVKIVAHSTEKSKRQLEREISIISKFQHPTYILYKCMRCYDTMITFTWFWNTLAEVNCMYYLFVHPHTISTPTAERAGVYFPIDLLSESPIPISCSLSHHILRFDYIMGRGRISEKMAVKFFRQMVSAVGYCHRNGVCHRDLKPENLILDEEGNIKINDFGLSNFFSPDSLLNSFCGSPIYAAPEIMAEKHYNGPAADVWSLGIVLYAMVVGQLPWKLDERGIICDVDDLIRARFTIPPSATTSPECVDLIRRMLVADPLSRLKLEDVARHPWILRGFGYPVNFNGEGTTTIPQVPKTLASTRKRATVAIMNHRDILVANDFPLKDQRRGSAPDNFFAKLFHRVSPRAGGGEKTSTKDKEPQIRTVHGTFQLDITTVKPPDHIMQEITKALHQSKIEQVNEGFVFHCVGKVNVKGKGDEPVSSYKIKFDVELCNVAGIHGLYGLHFKKVSGSVWLFRSLSIYLIDRMKL